MTTPQANVEPVAIVPARMSTQATAVEVTPVMCWAWATLAVAVVPTVPSAVQPVPAVTATVPELSPSRLMWANTVSVAAGAASRVIE